ncbi:MAG: hypothetical protein JJU36_07575 [Phycisphaeraceae bacterium]|nr:hypothetical protein [Phycisphaeraceae bacterium]
MEGWFISILILSAGSCALGIRVGLAGRRVTTPAIGILVGCIVFWSVLMMRPEWALAIAPLGLISRLESIGAAPLFCAMAGILWSMGYDTSGVRHRKLAMVCGAVCAAYLTVGGGWMIMPTPMLGLDRERGSFTVMQSRQYSCVPAAGATLLNRIGVPSSEHEMAILTHTRPRAGSTLLKAMHGLQHRLDLEGRDQRVRLRTASFEQLRELPHPMLATLRFELTAAHMVVLLSSDEEGVDLFDPELGTYRMLRADFAPRFGGRVLVVSPAHELIAAQ